MTVFNNAHNTTIHFLDQAFGTKNADTITLDTSSSNTKDPTPPTSIDGGGGDDTINITGVAQLNWDDINIEGGDGTDTLTLDVSGFGGVNITVGTAWSVRNINVSHVENLFLTMGDAADRFNGGAGNEVVVAGNGANIVHGFAGNDVITGGADHDELFGGNNNDTLNGGGGDDALDAGLGINTLNGGTGTDTVDFSSSELAALNLGVSVEIGAQTANFNGANQNAIKSVEIVIGTHFQDVMTGDASANTFYGGDDNDTLSGDSLSSPSPTDAGDSLFGGNGDDEIAGFAGDDTIDGGDDDDAIDAGKGADTITGGDGDDRIAPGADLDSTDGGAGRDTLDYADNDTTGIKVDLTTGKFYVANGSGIFHITTETDVNFEAVIGGDSNDEFIVGGTGGAINAGGGTDTLRSVGSAATLFGEDGDDTIFAGGAGDLAYGGDGNDTITGNANGATLSGDGGADTITGGTGDEDIAGGTSENSIAGAPDGADTLKGGAGVDVIMGGIALSDSDIAHLRADHSLTDPAIAAYEAAQTDASANKLFGGADNDYIFGANGKDAIDAGSGDDLIYGGLGNDTIHIGTGADQAFGGAGNDIIDGGSGASQVTLVGGDGNDTVVRTAIHQNDDINGDFGEHGASPFKDVLDLTAMTANVTYVADTSTLSVGATDATVTGFEELRFGSGNDNVTDGDNNTTLRGGDGNDTLNGGDGNDTLDGGLGSDTASYADGDAVKIDLTVVGAQNTGGQGTDTLTSIENLIGSTHNDRLVGDANGNRIDAGAGKDTIVGGDGANTLIGGLDADKITCGADADTVFYHFAADSTGPAYDIVTGFDFQEDRFQTGVSIGAIDTTIATGQLKSTSFDADLANAVDAGHLAGHDAVLFTPDSGNLAGKTFLVIDLNNVAGYDSGFDLVIQLNGASHIGNIDPGDFII